MKNYVYRSVRRIICIAILVVLIGSQSVFAANSATGVTYLDSVMELIQEHYYGGITDDKLIDNAIRGMLNSLDDYTTYYDNEEKDEFMDSITGVFGGIGISMGSSGDYIVVLEAFSGSPAEKAGMLQGDKITEANGINLVGASSDKAASIIKGEPGTIVKLGILRNGSAEKIYFNVVREIIRVNPVTYENRNGIGYIQLDMFNENTSEYFNEALAEFDKRKITNIVLDLRDNPGGEVGQAVALAEKIVPEGLITKLDYKSEQYRDIEYYSTLKQPKYKVAVLVNGMSASASEIVSGAVQDTGAGVLVGTKTFGKAKFQSLLPILTREAYEKYRQKFGLDTVNAYELYKFNIFPSDEEINGYAKMTLGVYYTPKGRMIDEAGLIPDIPVADPGAIAGVPITSIQRMTKSVDLKAGSQGSDISNAKKILKVMGYDITTFDSEFDKAFETALKKYQTDKGLNANGILDIKTQIALNANLLELILKYDTQYAAAVKYLKGK